METPPSGKSKLSLRRANNLRESAMAANSTEPTSLQSDTSTPSNRKKSLSIPMEPDNDDSPIYFPSTQETSQDIDVFWDWNSPQGKKRKLKQKRLLPSTTRVPLTLKRYPSQTQNQNFEKFRDEMRALQEQLAGPPDDEDFLCVSPQQEREYKDHGGKVEQDRDQHFADLFNDSLNDQLVIISQQAEIKFNVNAHSEPNKALHDPQVEDLFDDSFDDQLLLISQQVEAEIKLEIHKAASNMNSNQCDDTSDIDLMNTNCSTSEAPVQEEDSFDVILRSIKEDDLFNQTKQSNVTVHVQQQQKNLIHTESGKLEFHRTRSFELSEPTNQSKISQNVLEEIEKKRQEALAKRESKLKHSLSSETVTSKDTLATVSATKCSPDEIQQKRLDALRKLEAKKLKDTIEKNRLEAMKRLQSNRMKKAGLVKSTLMERL